MEKEDEDSDSALSSLEDSDSSPENISKHPFVKINPGSATWFLTIGQGRVLSAPKEVLLLGRSPIREDTKEESLLKETEEWFLDPSLIKK
jgi:hypothetical protein